MVATIIETEFKKKVCEQINLHPEGADRFRVFTPFDYGDGDLLSPVLKRDGTRWMLSDEGSTFMRLSYRLSDDALKGQRSKIIENAILAFGIENRDGELCTPVAGDAFGDALFTHIQAVLRISDVKYWTKSVVKATFMDDLGDFITKVVPEKSRESNWHDDQSDPDSVYPVDWRVGRNERPLFVFGIGHDEKCSTATIVIQHYQSAGLKFDSVAIYENMADISRKHLARLSDVVGKQFSSLAGNRKSITDYLAQYSETAA